MSAHPRPMPAPSQAATAAAATTPSGPSKPDRISSSGNSNGSGSGSSSRSRPQGAGGRYYLRPSLRSSILTSLTTTSHVSAAAFGSFLAVHLAPPLLVGVNKIIGSTLAVLGAGEGYGVDEAVDSASRIMLLGRVYYQSSLTEPILYASIGVHLFAAAAKRLLVVFTTPLTAEEAPTPSQTTTLPPEEEEEEEEEPRPLADSAKAAVRAAKHRRPLQLSQLHTLTGHLLIPLLGHHMLLNRSIPALSHPPIARLSPSELDYSYVSFGLKRSAVVLPMLYLLLISVTGVHVTTGSRRMWTRWAANRRRGGTVEGRRRRPDQSRWNVGGTVLVVISSVLGAGLVALSPRWNGDGGGGDGWKIAASMQRRMVACYRLAGL